MKTILEKKTVKIWFQGLSTSRNIYGVTEIDLQENLMKITNEHGSVAIVNFRNVNLLEEIE